MPKLQKHTLHLLQKSESTDNAYYDGLPWISYLPDGCCRVRVRQGDRKNEIRFVAQVAKFGIE